MKNAVTIMVIACLAVLLGISMKVDSKEQTDTSHEIKHANAA